MPKTRAEYLRIKRLHKEGIHDRCQFGCCPENPGPEDFEEQESKELADRLGPNDPRVALALKALELLPQIPEGRSSQCWRESLGAIAGWVYCLDGEKPDGLERILVDLRTSEIESFERWRDSGFPK